MLKEVGCFPWVVIIFLGFGIAGHSAFAAPSVSAKGSTWEQDTVSAEIRDGFFESSGLETYVSGWDEVARDLLWVHARKDSFEELRGRYPSIPQERLKTLQTRAKHAPSGKPGKHHE